MCMYGIIMSALIHTMIGKHHLKLDMLDEFFEQSVTKMLDHYTVRVGNRAADAATIQWNSSSADVSVFYVYVDGEKKAEVRAQDAVMEATVGGLAPKTAYRVWVTAADEAGNESLRSKTIEFVTRPQ